MNEIDACLAVTGYMVCPVESVITFKLFSFKIHF